MRLSPNPASNIITTIAGSSNPVIADNGPALFAALRSVDDVLVDASGNVIVADSLDSKIRKISPDGIITTVALTGGHLALDTSGNLFIADSTTHRVLKLAPNGVSTLVAGTGASGFSGDGGPATAAKLSFPGDVAVDGAGNVYISDSSNQRIRKVSVSGVITTIAGMGVRGFGGDGGPAASALLGDPYSLVVDGAGNVFFSDFSNRRIRRITPGGIISTVAGTGNLGSGGDGGPAVSADLASPSGIALDGSGNLYIADFTSHRIRMVDGAGVIQGVAGTPLRGFSGDGGPAIAAQLAGPRAVAVDAAGSLLIADTDNNRIRKVRVASPNAPAVAALLPSTGAPGTTISARLTGSNLSGATAITFSGTGVTGTIDAVEGSTALNVSITIAADAARTYRTLSVTTPAGSSDYFAGFGVSAPGDDRIVFSFAGNGTAGFGGDGGPAPYAFLNNPRSVAADTAGNVYIADSANHRIRKVTPSGVITTVAGNGTAAFSGDGGPATAASLRGPSDVAVDASGNLYIADTDNHRIRKVTTAGTISTVAGNGTPGFGGDGGPAHVTSLNQPLGVAVDFDGNLFIADRFNNRVRQVNTLGLISTVAGSGGAGFSGDGGPANAAQLAGPSRVAVSPLGELFVLDADNARVRKVGMNGVINTVAGMGNAGPTPEEGALATAVRLDAIAITLDPSGRLLIGADRVWRVDSSGRINAVAGGGTFAPSGGPPLMTNIQPFGLALDAAGNLFIAEGGNKVRVVAPFGTGWPLIDSLTRVSAQQGATVSATVKGANLTGATGVLFGTTGISATILPGGSSTTVPITIAIEPDAPTGPTNIAVMTPSGLSNVLSGGFVVDPAPSVLPQAGTNPEGTPAISTWTVMQGTTTAVAILGANLQGATSVLFAGSGVTATILGGGTDKMLPVAITVESTAALGDRPYTISTAAGTSAPRSGFSVVPAGAGDVITLAAGGVPCCNIGGSGGTAIAATLRGPRGITTDKAGNVYFAESTINRIRRITPLGVLETFAGAANSGGFSGDGGPASQALLGGPADVAFDPAGNLYIAEAGNNRIRKVTPGGDISTFAGVGTAGGSGDGGPATAAQLFNPLSVALDAVGNVYIADSARVRKVDTAGIISTIAGNGTPGFGGDGGPAAAARLSTMLALTVDAAGDLVIADRDNHRVRKIAGGIISTIAGTGEIGSNGDGGPAVAAQLGFPDEVFADAAGNLLIGSLGRVRMVNASGAITTLAGTGGPGATGDNGPATGAQIGMVVGIATDEAGAIWIADYSNNQVRKVTRGTPPVPSILSISPSDGEQGTRFETTVTGTHLSGAAGVVFSDTGVTAKILPGGTDTSVKLDITIDGAAVTGPRTLTLATRNSISAPFNGFAVGLTNRPRLTAILPATAAQGDVVAATITGANLTGVTAITFDGAGITATPSGPGTGASLPVTITLSPTATTGLRSATVTTASGGTSAPFAGLKVSPAIPSVSSMSVVAGTQGATVQAVISGTNLSTVTSVVFGAAGVFTTILPGATPTSLPVAIRISPTTAPGPVEMLVATGERISNIFDGFVIQSSTVPSVGSISPATALPGATIPATITGTNLNGATSVTFSGSGVTAAIQPGGTSAILPISISVSPGAALGLRTVTVTTPAGTSPAFSAFEVAAGSRIRVTSITTTMLTQNTSFTAMISGSGLSNPTGVSFSGTGIVASITGNSLPTSFTIAGTVAANAPLGVRTVTVTTTAGTSEPFNGVIVIAAPKLNVIQTFAGTGTSGYSGDGYNAAQLFRPSTVFVDSAGSMFIADNMKHRVRKITSKGVISTVAGTGTSGYSGDNGQAVSARLNNPSGLAVDAAGNLFIADTDNHRIRKVAPNGVITTVAGNGAGGFGGDGGDAVFATLNRPLGLVFDSAGNLFIADSANHRVRRIGANNVIDTFAGIGTPGFNGDGIAPWFAQLDMPNGLALDGAGNLLIAEVGNHRIRKVSGGLITTVAGNGGSGSTGDGGPATAAQIGIPMDVDVDAGGNIVIVDSVTSRVRKVNPAGVINTIAGTGSAGFSGDDGPGTSAQLNNPANVAVTPTGDVLVADTFNNRIRRINPQGLISTAAGSGAEGVDGDGPAARFAQMRFPNDVASDAAGNVFFIDYENRRVRKITPEGMVTSFAGNGANGFSGDGGPAVAAQFASPEGIAVDGSGNVYIAERTVGRIRKVTPSGIITTVAGTTLGFSGDGGPASLAQLMFPIGVAVDRSNGNLYIADSGNHRVRVVTPDGIINTIAGDGIAGSSGDGGPAAAARLRTPEGVAVDVSGNLYIADPVDHRVRKVDPARVITTFAGTGADGNGGDNGLSILAQLHSPAEVEVDAAGNVFIQDTSDSRIRMVNAGGLITTVAGTGAFGFSGDGGTAAAAQIWPNGIGVDGRGDLYIAGSERIRKVSFTPAANLPAVTGISPFSAPQATAIAAVISGSELNGATAVTVSGSGVTATITGGGTAQSLPVTINVAPDAPLGTRTFTVTTANGTSEIYSGFTVRSAAPRPEITSLAPPKGLAGTTRSAVIAGSGFTGATEVTFSGSGVTATIEPGATDTALPISITMTSDAALTLRTVSVTADGGTSAAFNGFAVARPTITGISPSTGMAGFVLPATINGQNLANATAVSIGGGVTATILNGGTDNQVPVMLSISPGVAAGARQVLIAAGGASSAPFNGFTVAAFSPFGMMTTFAGDGSNAFKGDGGPATSAGLNAAGHIAFDAAGNLYISDRNHYRVRKVSTDGTITTVAGNGSPQSTGDGGPATLAGLDPSGLAFDAAGNLFVSDQTGGRVRRITPAGIINTVAGNGTLGYSGDGGSATLAQLNQPVGLAIDSAGNLYIADSANQRIRKVAPPGIITTFAGNGTSGFLGDGGAATAARLFQPLGIRFDASGSLFIADSQNYRIRKVATNGVITTVAGSGNIGFAGDGGPATSANLTSPTNVAFDPQGNLLIADTGNNRVRRVTAQGLIETIAGSGSFFFTVDGGAATASGVNPTSIAFDAAGNMYVADFQNLRVRRISYVPTATVMKRRNQVTSQ